MGDVRGFIKFERSASKYRPVEERIGDYNEVNITIPVEELTEEGARCMDCGTPFCHSLGCPLANLIPEWNDLVFRGKWEEAWMRLELTNNFPEITGRLCPAPCEESCTLSINRAPVSIKQIERAIIEKAFGEGWVIPRPPETETGRHIAIVGSGPSGLAAGQQLRRAGHRVTVFEKSDRPGGILMYGIPNFKLEKDILERRLDQLREEGVIFETDVEVGVDISARYLKKKFDAVLLAMGAGEPRDLDVPGRDLEGIVFALDYLSCATKGILEGKTSRYSGQEEQDSQREKKFLSAEGKRVLVIGGGDTGSDCVGTATRQGATSVTQIEILPKPMDWRESYNPQWPYWPKKLRKSSSHEEAERRGILKQEWSVTVKEFRGKRESGNNDMKTVGEAKLVRVEWKKSGNGYKPTEIPGSQFTIESDLVILAMGFLHVKHSKLLSELGLEFNERGNIKIDRHYMTSVPGIFAAGDSHTGASLIVRALNHGRRAASSIDSFLG